MRGVVQPKEEWIQLLVKRNNKMKLLCLWVATAYQGAGGLFDFSTP
jgi:hypothetical protein